MTKDQMPPQIRMMQLLDGMVVSRCISVCAELGVADQLEGGPRSAADLAAAVGADSDGLYRVLRTLAGIGVFAELPDRQFENTALSDLLRSDSPHSVRAISRWLGHPLHWKVIGDLDFSVATGKPALLKTHPDKRPLEVLFADDSARATFGAAMAEVSSGQHEPIVEAYDFSPYRRIVDVGGGHGALAAIIAAETDEVSITVYDLPHVVEAATAEIEKRGLGDRITAIGGNFLEQVPGPADLCVLKWILHLWSDEVATQVLRNCSEAVGDAGRLLVVEMLLEPGPSGIPARSMDLEMLTGSGGRERTEAEFAAIFEAAGFELARVIPTTTPMRLIEGIKAPG